MTVIAVTSAGPDGGRPAGSLHPENRAMAAPMHASRDRVCRGDSQENAGAALNENSIMKVLSTAKSNRYSGQDMEA
jgi:hypothetical protein